MTVCFHDLSDLAQNFAWSQQPFAGFCLDTRQLQPGQIFIALSSYSQPEKVLEFAQMALKNGALAVISEQALALPQVLHCPDVRQRLGVWQQQYLSLSRQQTALPVIAVTGTNGKTTISRLVAELISLNGLRCAVMGTTGNGILPDLKPSTHTTLDAVQLQLALYDYVAQGAALAVLEASSHGLDQGRLNGCDIQIAIFSNLSRDHLDYHGSFDAYAAAKARLFAMPSLKLVMINAADPYAEIMLQAARENPTQPQILTYSAQASVPAHCTVEDIRYTLSGSCFTLHHPHGTTQVNSPFLGQFNIENVLASIMAAHAYGIGLAQVVAKVPLLQGAPGRMQVIQDAERLFVVDYAHTPDALEQVLRTLKHHVQGQLWVVFGCGGDRDRGKRPLMTAVARSLAQQVLLTLDNPRSENPTQIFADMMAVPTEIRDHYNAAALTAQNQAQLQQIHDRRAAIAYAVEHAQAGDIVLVAGKGHENYQEIQGVRHHFDDVVELRLAIEAQYQCSQPSLPAQKD